MAGNKRIKEFTQPELIGIIQQLHEKKISPEQCYSQYGGLFSRIKKDPSKIELKTKYHHLLFNPDAVPDLTDEQMQLVFQRPLNDLRQKYLATGEVSQKVLDMRGFRLDFSSVGQDYSFPEFDLLSQGRGIFAPHIRGNHEWPQEVIPSVNLAIALTLWGCKRGQGRVLWQQKERSTSPEWQRVPDLVYQDYTWKDNDEVKMFTDASYNDWYDQLNADLGLEDHDIVMPCTLDCCGEALVDHDDARVSAAINGGTAPLVAISIPGKAFIGWVSEMIPNVEDVKDLRTHFRAAAADEPDQFLVPQDRLANAHTATVQAMFQRLVEMYENPREGSIVFYESVRGSKLAAIKAADTEESAPTGAKRKR